MKVVKYIEKSIWKDDTKQSVVMEVAKNYIQALPKNLLKEKTLHRVCGQSASGKTTQIMQSLNIVLKKKKADVCHLAVRNFAVFHPDYKMLKNKFGKKHLREKTNGFALKCLAYTLMLAMQKGFLIVLEITLLKKVFENFVLDLTKEYNYKIKFHILAVPPKISDMFLEKRNKLKNILLEDERLTYKKSSNYFNRLFPKSFKFLCSQKKVDASVVIWNAFDKMPWCFENLKTSKKVFFKERKTVKKFMFSEQELCASKIDFYEKSDCF